MSESNREEAEGSVHVGAAGDRHANTAANFQTTEIGKAGARSVSECIFSGSAGTDVRGRPRANLAAHRPRHQRVE